MNVIIPIGYAFFDKNKYSNSTLQKLLTIKRKEILYKKEKWKIGKYRSIQMKMGTIKSGK